MNKNLEEISDGKRYGLNDMVRAACNDCAGCSSCCEDMGESIILDPLDIYELTKNMNTTFENLLKEQIELHVADGMILPNLKMTDKDVCPFLKEKRCSIHSFRPGICRVFPLGRIYEENRLDYFLQVDGCAKENRSKIKVSKKTITMFLLNTFYINPYDTEQDFYLQFYARLDRIAQVIA